MRGHQPSHMNHLGSELKMSNHLKKTFKLIQETRACGAKTRRKPKPMSRLNSSRSDTNAKSNSPIDVSAVFETLRRGGQQRPALKWLT